MVSDKQGLVLVDGATGYLGSHLTEFLLSQGHDVRCLVRKGARASEVALLKTLGAEVSEGDLDDPATKEHFQGAKYCVHLIGSIAPPRGQSFEQLHVSMTAKFLQYAKENGAEKIILVTALGSRADSPSRYHMTKWQSEEAVRNSGLAYTILQPSLLVGRAVGERNSKLVKRLIEMLENKPFVPLINGGVNKIQPLFIRDAAEAIANCISPLHNGETIELGGSTVLSMKRFVEELQDVVGKRKPIINLHPGAGKLLASVMEAVQDVPTLSTDQVALSLSDNICRLNGLPTLIGREGASLDVALDTYRKNPIGTKIT